MKGIPVQNLFITVVIIIYWFKRQVRIKPVKTSRYTTIPIILTYFALSALDKFHGNIIYNPVILFSVAVGIVNGIMCGIGTKIFRGDDGVLYQQGGIITAVLLFMMLVINIGIRIVLSHDPRYSEFLSDGLCTLLMFSCQYITRSAVVLTRSPEVREQYKKDRKAKKNKIEIGKN